MDGVTTIGVLGAGLLLVAFVANQFGKLNARSFLYDILNFVGAGLLVWYAILLDSLPFLILEGIWALVALRDFITKLAERRKTKKMCSCC
jgi:hypothetical protein